MRRTPSSRLRLTQHLERSSLLIDPHDVDDAIHPCRHVEQVLVYGVWKGVGWLFSEFDVADFGDGARRRIKVNEVEVEGVCTDEDLHGE